MTDNVTVISSRILGKTYEDIEKAVPTLFDDRPIASNDHLLRRDVLLLAVSEVEKLSAPCGPDSGKRWAKTLVGAYPAREMNSPEIFMHAIAADFAEFHDLVCREAFVKITRNCKFLPSRAEVFQTLTQIKGRLNGVKIRAQKQLELHDARALETDREIKIAASKAAFRQKHGDKSPLEVLREQGMLPASDNSKGKT